MNYRFQNILGAPYRGGNAVISGNNKLISPVGNHISITDLLKSETINLPCQSSANITRIAVSPDGNFILAVDENSRAQFINLHRRIVHKNVKKRKEFDGKEREFEDEKSEVFLHKKKWELLKKDYFMQAPAKLVTCDYHQGLELVVVGFSRGVFGLYQMPDFVVHITREDDYCCF